MRKSSYQLSIKFLLKKLKINMWRCYYTWGLINFMWKKCKTCSQQFEIQNFDREFYKRFDVPEPEDCPTCRNRLRLSFKNEQKISIHECGICKKRATSLYPDYVKFPVYCNTCMPTILTGRGKTAISYIKPYTKGFIRFHRIWPWNSSGQPGNRWYIYNLFYGYS